MTRSGVEGQPLTAWPHIGPASTHTCWRPQYPEFSACVPGTRAAQGPTAHARACTHAHERTPTPARPRTPMDAHTHARTPLRARPRTRAGRPPQRAGRRRRSAAASRARAASRASSCQSSTSWAAAAAASWLTIRTAMQPAMGPRGWRPRGMAGACPGADGNPDWIRWTWTGWCWLEA